MPSIVQADVGSLTTLHSFTGTPDGAVPEGGVIRGTDGNYYGTTSQGGGLYPPGVGTVFKIADNGTETPIYSFTGNTSMWPCYCDGAMPSSGLLLGADGNFYGTTPVAGYNSWGSVFKVSPAGQESLLYSFSGYSEGGKSYSPLLAAANGGFYGLTASGVGGSFYTQYGAVFSLSSSGFITVLHAFAGGTDGAYPQALVHATDGNLYGTVPTGGSNGTGLVFRITPDGTYSVLYNFAAFGNSNDGAQPAALIQGTDGNLYGTTLQGGNGGTVFRLTLAGQETILYRFTGSPDGQYPASLVQGSDGNLYGTTIGGGLSWAGTVFELSLAGQETTLYSLFGPPAQFYGVGPYSGGVAQPPLLETATRTFLGTSAKGGDHQLGSVYRLAVSTGTPAPEVRLNPLSTSFNLGDSTTLYWSSIGTSSCTASGDWSGAQATTGSQLITPATVGTHTYTLSCNTASGVVTGSTTLTANVPPPPQTNIIINGSGIVTSNGVLTTVVKGDSATLSWSAHYANSCTASGAWSGPQPTSGTKSLETALTGKRSFTITCTGLGGTTSATAIEQVVAAAPSIDSFTASPTTIKLGQTSVLSWQASNAQTCYLYVGQFLSRVRMTGQYNFKPTTAGGYGAYLQCEVGSLTATSNFLNISVN